MELEFKLVTDRKQYPYELFLLADETVGAIDKYLFDSGVYTVNRNGEVIGAFCLYETDACTIEVKNIAVAEKWQNRGIGSRILTYVKQLVGHRYRRIIIGTPDIATNQIRFYERNGFEQYDVRRNFYIDNYDDPIIENGVRLKDMILLKFEIA